VLDVRGKTANGAAVGTAAMQNRDGGVVTGNVALCTA
jgi:hypothetical protein